MQTGRKYYRAGIVSPSMKKIFESITQEDGKILRDELDRQNRRIRRAEVRKEYKDWLLKEELRSRGTLK
jgi:hypothetical protein